MKKLFYFPLLFLFAFSLSAQTTIKGPVSIKSPVKIAPTGSSGSFTAVNSTTGFTSGTTTGLTVPSTGSGNLLTVQAETNGTNAGFLTSVTGGCTGSWIVPAGAQIGVGGVGSVSSAYCIGSSSGTTSITLNFGSNQTYVYAYFEVSDTAGHTPTLDTGGSGGVGTVSNTSTSTNPTGVALTVSGSNMAVFQVILCNAGTVTAVSGPYGSFTAAGSSGPGWADALNITSGSAPTWTNATTSVSIGAALAFNSN